MRNLIFSVFAIGVAAVAAMTATTAMLNAPQRPAPAVDTTALVEEAEGTAPASLPAALQGTPPATSGGTPEAAKPATSTETAEEEEGDKDPYEGIAEEELPPDLQYSADSSVSFPTNI